MIKPAISLLLLLLIGVAVALYHPAELALFGHQQPANASTVIPIDSSYKPGRLSFANDVQPILASRCAACHAGYDAPCQLDLTSADGLLRGAAKQPAMSRFRFSAAEATRLSIDAATTADWRERGFFAVVNEKAPFPEINLNRSLIAKFLTLKQDHPLSPVGKLPGDVIGAKPVCPTLDEMSEYRQLHPWFGMPYALPPLRATEQRILLHWLQDGAKTGTAATANAAANPEIKKWESFFNDATAKNRLVARYLYEHLQHADLYFKDHADYGFYRLVRSKTPSGVAIDALNTRYPYAPPAVAAFYYRLQPVTATPVDKTHNRYELSNGKMERYRELFLTPDYAVANADDETAERGTNPFADFASLPVASRYRFLLDDARFFIDSLAKSPAFSVGAVPVRDQVWIVFLKPQAEFEQQTATLLSKHGAALALPIPAHVSHGLTWLAAQQDYWRAQRQLATDTLLKQRAIDFDAIWRGDNNDGGYSVFRHGDNAAAAPGLLGKTPTSAWVLDYPLLERMYYLLVAGFDRYGSAAQHWTTRVAMDMLRREAEDNFLQFLPQQQRRALRNEWYQSLDGKLADWLGKPDGGGQETAIVYQTDDAKTEFFNRLQQQTGADHTQDALNQCLSAPCPTIGELPDQQRLDAVMQRLADSSGQQLTGLPEMSLLRVKTAEPANDPVYTLIRNRRRSASLFGALADLLQKPEQDSLTIATGCLGSYPNVFFDVRVDELENFADQLQHAQTAEQIDSFYSRFAIRRNNDALWDYYDWLAQKCATGPSTPPRRLDLSRYQNL